MLTKDAVRSTLAQLEKALAGINLPGFQIKLGRSTYRDTITTKIEIMPISVDGEVVSKEAVAFKELATIYGLKPEHLGQKVVVNGTQYEIIGLAHKSHRFPILAKRGDGKTFKFPAESIRMKLGVDQILAQF